MKNLINKLKQFNGVQFVAINNYTNKQGEISKVLLNVGASIQNAKQKDINTLKGISYDYETIEEKARIELLTALTKPTKQTKNRSQGQKDAYVQLCTGIRMHIETKTIYIYGLQVRKNVVQKGEYKTVNSRPLTIAKNIIRKTLKHTKFRQYSLSKIDTLTFDGETLTIN
tara:strand:+ start:21689 stop:22198 length:510 start_codon:yes stop_codon:yes gene_type:complete